MSVLRDLVGRQVLVCDGAMGTLLHAVGNSLDRALVELNLTDPALVRSLHDAYVDAGVDILQTNTFGASRLRLAGHGIPDRVEDVNREGVRIARAAADAAGRQVFVAGSVSPAVTVQQRRKATADERRDALRGQIGALARSGVDLLVLETFGYLDELVEAIRVAVETTDLPVIAQSTFASDGRTLSGHTPAEVAPAVEAAAGTALLALGVNCTLGPHGSLAVLQQLAEHTAVPLSAQPNAGLPRRVAPSRFEFEVDSDYFARYAAKMVDAGAAIVGGCCGTTPDHVAAVVEVVSGRSARHGRAVVTEPEPAPAAPAAARLIGDTGFVVGAQLSAAGGAKALSAVVHRADAVRRAGVELVMVRATPSARAQGNPVSVAAQLQDQLGLSTVTGIAAWNKTIMGLQAHLLGAHARGVRRIVCETGNPLLVGDYPHADGRWEVDSVGLVELLAGLNEGADHNGLRLAARTRFEIGAWINPGAQDVDAELRRARAKLDAGAHFLVTRPVYEETVLLSMLDQLGGRVPVLASLRPLASFAEAEYLVHEVPDVLIPKDALDALDVASGAARQREVGVELAVELAGRLRPSVQGLLVAVEDDVTALTGVIAAVHGSTRPSGRAEASP